MYKTLRLSFSLRNAYRVNSILYSLKQLPLIKRVLPADLYGSEALNIFANMIAVIWELLSVFLGKLLYIAVMIFFPVNAWQYADKSALFLHIFVCLSAIGALLNTYLFNPTRDKYYAIVLLRMNARQFALTDYAYAMAKLLAGFLVFGLLFGLLAGVPIWLCLLFPLFVIGLKMMLAARSLRVYEKTEKAVNENLPGKVIWSAAAVLLAAAYGLPALGVVMPWWASAMCMVVGIAGGLLSVRTICTFEHYRACYQQLLKTAAVDSKAVAAAAGRKQSDKLISADTTIASRKKGFDYLNELFVRRHRKLLWQSSLRIAGVCAALLVMMLLGTMVSPELKTTLNGLLMNSLPWFVFIMYLLNRGTGFTRALFMNCDHSLLTYSIYKQPRFVLRLFRLRLWEITKVNLLPALVIGPGLALLLFLSGGTPDPLNYAVLALSIPAMSVFFSVHYLTIYYLLQPYNAGTEIKSAAYQIILSVTYLICFYIMQLELPTRVFGAGAIVFCLLYSLVACLLVYRIAPKTFRLRG